MEAPIRVLYVGGGACEDHLTALERDGIDLETVDAATALARSDTAGCVVSEQALGETTGLDLLAELRDGHPDLPLILFPGDGDEALASDAITASVTEYVPRAGPDAYDCLAERIRSVTDATDGQSERASDAESSGVIDADCAAGREQTLAELHAATRNLMAAVSPTEICEIAVRAAKDILGLPLTSVFLYDEEAERLEPVANTQETWDLFGDLPAFTSGESMIWHTFETDELVYQPDVREAERVYNPDTSVRTELQIPLGDYGVLVTASSEREEFDDHDIDFAQLFAANVEVALERARRVKLLRERERELRESRERIRQITENIDSSVWMTDHEKGEIVYASPGHEEVWGADISAGDDPAKILDCIHDADRERIPDAITSGGPREIDVEYRIDHPDDGIRWVHNRTFGVRDDDEGTRIVGITDDITVRKRRERELERYEQIFETIQDRVCVLDENGEFLLVNDPFLAMVGYEREDLFGAHVSTVVANEDAERTLLREEETSMAVETDVVTADGERIPAEIDIATLSDSGTELHGTVGVVRDISDRKRVRAELEQERDRLSALFENIPDPVVRTEFRDGEPVIGDVNRAFERMFGADEDEIVGERLNDFLVPPDETEVAERIDERAQAGKQVQEEVRRQTDTGIRNFLLRGVPMQLDGGGDDREGYAIYTDITDQKTRERRRQVLNRVLRHNMRNEMNVISGYAELVDPDADAERIEAAATAIEETASDVADLSNKIREIERTLDRADDNHYPVDLVALVDRAVAPHVDADVDLVTDLPDRLTVTADDGLERALEHLLDNAVEHNDRAVPSVRVDGRRVGDDWVEIEIRDDGPGIPNTERAVLTGDREITQLDHGSGLGLWLANWIVTALGGKVQFDDNEPRGSIVTVRLQAAD